MPLAKCVRCDKLFNKVRGGVCPDCMPAEDADQEKVRRVLEQGDDLNIEAVAERAEVEVGVVRRMMDEGLVASATLAGASVVCGKCGAPAISLSKRLCEKCLAKLNQEMLSAQTSLRAAKPATSADEPGGGSTRETFDAKRRI